MSGGATGKDAVMCMEDIKAIADANLSEVARGGFAFFATTPLD